jgi:antitoxin ParD1/3/4
MNVSLTRALELLIEKKVNSGRYGSASEVVREALRLLEERDLLNAQKLRNLKSDVAIGLREARQGKTDDARAVFAAARKRVKSNLG